MQTYYLVKPTNITKTGVLTGKTLCCYEVTTQFETTSRFGTRFTHKPTGYKYVIKNDRIQKVKTSANLISCVHNLANPYTTLPLKRTWGSSIFTAPELALRYKSLQIETLTQASIHKLTSAVEKLQTLLPTQSTQFIVDEHPELFI